ncbi:TonB-dependent receptor [Bacteroides fragilis]|uniref:TonB-dependent receptor n=1 Tax=Bacteroides fragilis TaxID=817 RepID=UPI0020305F1D|nr:TonB-dependent receptor [Bacteroides fragilis]MCM0271734.1 TonB-dependent receptor [Bacteroides fragilis]
MKTKYLNLLCLLIINVSVLAQTRKQTINGIIKDSQNGESIPYATIISGEYFTTSNSEGYFSIPTKIQFPFKLEISYIGYETCHVMIEASKQDSTIVIELQPDIINLPEVIIRQKEQLLKQKSLGNVQLDMGKLNQSPLFLGINDPIKLIQFLPGVSGGMEGSSQLNIRGGNSDQTLFLMDGLPIYNQNHAYGFISFINPDAVKSIELYKSGVPSMYGDKLSGFVNLMLKDGNVKQHHQSLSIGPIMGSFTLEGPIKKNKVSYLLTARRSLIDLLYLGASAIGGVNASGVPVASFYDINGKIAWNMTNNSKLSLQVYNGYDDMFNKTKEESFTQDKLNNKYGQGWGTFSSSLKYAVSLRSKLYLSTSLYYTNLNKFDYSNQKITFNNQKAIHKFKNYSKMYEFGLRTNLEQYITTNNTLQYGINLSSQEYQPEQYSIKSADTNLKYGAGSYRLWTASVYVYNEFKKNGWILGTGLRSSLYNNTDRSVFTLEPRINLTKFLGRADKLMLAYDRTSQPTHSIYETNYNMQSDFWVPFKEKNVPTADQLSLGWKNFALTNWELSIEAYYRKIKNLIRINNLENYLDAGIDYSKGTGDAYGMEFMVQYNKNRFSGWFSYTISKSERKFEGKKYPFKYDSPNQINLFLSLTTKKTATKTQRLSMNLQYKTGYPYAVSNVSYPSIGLPMFPNGYPDINTSIVKYIPQEPNTRLKDYFRIDLNYTMEKKLKHGSRIWQFSLLNVTGHKNPYSIYQNNSGQYKAFVLIPFMPSFSYTRYF